MAVINVGGGTSLIVVIGIVIFIMALAYIAILRIQKTALHNSLMYIV